MTQEEKQLLFRDLCARLPYKVKVHIEHDIFYDEREPYDTELNLNVLSNQCAGMEIKPYLRPMSSMTDEEFKTYEYFLDEEGLIDCSADVYVDWLLERHFDFRGLIPKGLALEALEEMYNTKTE